MGYIKPLYKGDDATDPGNYRGITVMSCLAKLFHSILNNRLQNYLDTNKIINPCHIGFQPNARTVDHLFILRTLIEKYRRMKKPKPIDTFLYQHFKLTGHSPNDVLVQPVEKLTFDKNSSSRFKIIKRHETELKWIKLLQTLFPLGFNDNIYHEGNISKMPDFDVFSLLKIRKRKSRSHGLRKKGNSKRKKRAVKRSNTSLKDLSKVLEDHGRHSVLSFLSSLPISVLRVLDTEANKFYDRNHQLYDAALLRRCYTQHALRPFIYSETNHKRHFIKIPFINKGIEFIDLPSIFKDRSVTSSIPTYFQNSEPPVICYKYNKPIRNTVFNFNKLVSDLDIHANTPES